MPCQDYRTNDVVYIKNPVDKELKKRLDKVTRLLCYLCGKVENIGPISRLNAAKLIKDNDELNAWWQDHKEQDRKAREEELRKQRERDKQEVAKQLKESLRKSGISKLSKAEKEALGLI